MEHYKVAIESEKWFFDFVQRFDVLVQRTGLQSYWRKLGPLDKNGIPYTSHHWFLVAFKLSTIICWRYVVFVTKTLCKCCEVVKSTVKGNFGNTLIGN